MQRTPENSTIQTTYQSQNNRGVLIGPAGPSLMCFSDSLQRLCSKGNEARKRGRSFHTQRFSFSETERLKGSNFSRNRFGPTYTATLSELSRGRPFHSLSGDRCDWLQARYHFSPAHAAAFETRDRMRLAIGGLTLIVQARLTATLEAETNLSTESVTNGNSK